MADETTLEQLVTKLLAELPQCDRHGCEEPAEFFCVDAAGDAFRSCAEHRIFKGGWDQDVDPFPLRYAETVREIKKLLARNGDSA
jgi:hypothetical protein